MTATELPRGGQLLFLAELLETIHERQTQIVSDSISRISSNLEGMMGFGADGTRQTP